MGKLVTLYKKTSKGQPQEWSIFVDGDTFWAEYGLVGGKIQSDKPTICEGKNVGKKNETSPEQQARLEAESKIKKQKDKGYSESLETQGLDFTPMLSHEFGKHGSKLPEFVAVSQKLDGTRIFITKDGAFSRNGKPVISAKFIQEDLKRAFRDYPDMIVDGEIYNHKFKDDFNKIVSLVKKQKNITEEEWAEISENLELHYFDFFFKDKPDLGFKDRYNSGMEILAYSGVQKCVPVAQHYINKSEVDEYHERFLKEGYEGIMVRDPDSPYQQKRSYYLQKYKNFQDAEFKILDLEEGKGNWAGKCMKMTFKAGGGIFEAVPKGTEEYRQKLFENKQDYIGKMATVKFQNLTPEGIPRFGIVTAIRDYD